LLILFERVLSDICNAVITGVNVKLSSFGNFFLRSKGERVGRNPKTGVEVPIEQRRVMVFKPSEILKAHMNGEAAEGDD
jgi:integration host factor subunit alpha